MFNSVVLDVFIGLIFVFLLYSLLATILQEMVARWLNLRSRMLLKAVRRMLQDEQKEHSSTIINAPLTIIKNIVWFFSPFYKSKENLAKAFFDYPSIKYLAESNWNSRPSYIDQGNFSQTMIYLLSGDGFDGTTPQMNLIRNALFIQRKFQAINGNSSSIDNETLKYLQKIYHDANNDIDKFRALLEKWFNDTMDRATGWYKKQTQFILFTIGLMLAISFNVDTIAIYNLLAKDKTARQNLVQLAISSAPKYDSLVKASRSLSGPVDSSYQQINIASGRNGKSVKKDSIKKVTYIKYVSLPDSELVLAKSTIQADIDQANNIAALGWPDKDSCKACESLKADLRVLLAYSKEKADTSAIDSIAKKISYYNSTYKCLGNPYQNKSTRIIGWLLTAIAISLGAPFWFDLLNKLINLRGSGPKPQSADSNNTVASSNQSNANTPGNSPINRVG